MVIRMAKMGTQGGNAHPQYDGRNIGGKRKDIVMKRQKKSASVKATGTETTRLELMAALVKGVFMTILASVLLVQAESHASELPALSKLLSDQLKAPSSFSSKVGQGASAQESSTIVLPALNAPLLYQPVAPSVFQEKVGQGSSGQGPSTSDPEIQELARALRYDPGLMYKFVHDYINYSLMWGDIKGPYMTWMDRKGNGFDQASLMIALLEEAEEHSTESEYTITDPNYVVGEIQLSATEADDWLGIVDDPNMARQVLARAGIYGTVTEDGEGDISNIKMEHVWVTVTIDGNDYEFDPSFKKHAVNSGLYSVTLVNAMGYSQQDFIYDANEGSSSGTSWIKDINDTNIESDLSTYSTNLVNYIKDPNNGLSDGGLADVIGGRSIIPADANALPPASLPYTVESRDDEFDIDNVPDLYRTSLRIVHYGIDETFWSSDIYGRRLTLRYSNVSLQPELVLDGTVEATGNVTTWGQLYPLILLVDHPYDVNDFNDVQAINVFSGGFYQIVNGWGDTGTKILEKHRALLEQYRFDGLSDSSEQVLGESYALVGLTWLVQNSRMRSMMDEIGSQCMLTNHHMLGVTGQWHYPVPYLTMMTGHLGVYSDQDPNGIFLTLAGHCSAYGHEVIRQLQDCNAVSTVELLDMANDLSDPNINKIFYTDSSNWSSEPNVQSQLEGYNQNEKNFVGAYVENGFSAYLPQYGDLNKDDWTGMCFEAVRSTADLLSISYNNSMGFNAGSSTIFNTSLAPSEVFDRSYVPNPGNGDADIGVFGFGATDLTIGNRGFPFGLSFSRQYSSKRRLEDGPLGLGWTHNFDIVAKVTSDSFQLLGEDSPIDAAPHIVSLYVTNDILTDDSSSLMNNMIASLSEAWLMDQMETNLVTIKQGASTMEFTRIPDCNDPNGMYSAPTGTNLKLVVDVNDNFLLKNGSGVFYHFDSDNRISKWSDPHGNFVEFSYDIYGKLTDVESYIKNKIGDGNSPSHSLSFIYDGDHITDVNDSAGRSIEYTYDVDDNLIEYTTPDGNDYTFDYDDVNDGQLTEIYTPVDANIPALTNVYDTLGRIKQQTDANDNSFDFFHAYYRSERLEPNQTDPNDNTARFSTATWFNEYRRAILTQDQLGRENTYGYDGLLRLTSMASQIGTSAEFEYDENNRVTDANSIVIAGSGDPNMSVSNDYDSYENDDGRWFVAKKEHTDPNEHDVTYEYDYDDPNEESPVGNLMKITYQEVDSGNDANRPVVTFTYYPDGHINTKTDPEGMVTKFYYTPAADGADPNKIVVDYGTGRLNITTEMTYDSVGRVATVKDPLGNITQNQYYDSGLLKKTIAPDPNYVTEFEYREDGKLIFVKSPLTDPNQTIILQAITYTDTGQKKTVRGPYVDGNDLGINLTQFTYDNLGRLWKVEDAENNVTETRYYPDGKVWKVIDAEGHDVITNTYDPNGTLIKVEDANDNATEYEYNGFMGLKKTIYEDGTYTQPGYNAIRGLETILTRAGDTISVKYDDLRRVKKKILPDNTIYYKYDLCGRVLETTDKRSTIKNTYDTAGRLTKVEYPGDKEVSYEYNAAGQRTKLTYPDDSHITYEYDNLGRLTKIRDDSSTILSSYTFDKRSRRTNLSYANGTAISYQYDESSRLKDVNNVTDTDGYRYVYTYDNVGNRLSMTFNGTDQHIYTYDDIYQVTDVDYPTAYTWISDTEFNYDDAGNRTSVIDGGTTTYTANELNQYSVVGDVWYEYDDNGNLTYDGTGFYSYDAENHLIQATNDSGAFNGPLNKALDCFDFEFTTGGSGTWALTTSEYCDDPNHDNDRDSAECDQVPVEQSSSIETTVYGYGYISFCWKAEADTRLSFSVDGHPSSQPGTGSWQEESNYNISGLGKHTVKWTFDKESGSVDDKFFLDNVRWTSNNPTPSTELQEALDTDLSVVTDGDWDWTKTTSHYHNDGDSARSGNIDDEGEEITQMEILVVGEGTLTFWWKVDSEDGCDELQFIVDGV